MHPSDLPSRGVILTCLQSGALKFSPLRMTRGEKTQRFVVGDHNQPPDKSRTRNLSATPQRVATASDQGFMWSAEVEVAAGPT
ncbi:hypothetical protein AVEN_199666-1 [Araneus ventricosus]|uniref:Uncharacterized protein n=1 Tax=Araneus ventricosus TaxID=182803 RepID=A0A4Y2DF37_ARAVE|nr:hypothetical protein AVEN_199666-1 [Araneus ventricosus]